MGDMIPNKDGVFNLHLGVILKIKTILIPNKTLNVTVVVVVVVVVITILSTSHRFWILLFVVMAMNLSTLFL